MSTIVLAGGGLACWYVSAHLLREGHGQEIWFADAEQIDERLVDRFVEAANARGITLHRFELRPALAEFGLELARYQGRYDNGYWNTTAMLRVALAQGVCHWMPDTPGDVTVTHGCVAFGNDQQRMERLIGKLAPEIPVRPLLAELAAAGRAPSRTEMIKVVREEFELVPFDDLTRKDVYSSDGSIIGCANEGSLIENPSSDWTQAPFVMTADPLQASLAEEIEIEISDGQVQRVGAACSAPVALLSAANAFAGRHGVGRLGVMEDKIRGSKCRGVYEAPGLTLIGEAYRQLYEALLPGTELAGLKEQSRGYSHDIYNGLYFLDVAAQRRLKLAKLTADITGIVRLVARGGYLFCRSIETSELGASIEQRFNHGGVVWEHVHAHSGAAE